MRLLFLLAFGIWATGACAQQVSSDSTLLKGDTVSSNQANVKGDVKTSTVKESYWGRPQKAALYSAILPGMGQVYNHEVWKVPILYAGIGFLGYLWSDLDIKYHQYDAAVNNLASVPPGPNPYPQYTQSQIIQIRDYYRRNRDYTIIISTLVYLLQITDAHVFAHLRGFNVNNNLAFQPTILPAGPIGAVAGINIRYQLSNSSKK
jgi:hypothetical protein